LKEKSERKLKDKQVIFKSKMCGIKKEYVYGEINKASMIHFAIDQNLTTSMH
jgi:hypothetical protein